MLGFQVSCGLWSLPSSTLEKTGCIVVVHVCCFSVVFEYFHWSGVQPQVFSSEFKKIILSAHWCSIFLLMQNFVTSYSLLVEISSGLITLLTCTYVLDRRNCTIFEQNDLANWNASRDDVCSLPDILVILANSRFTPPQHLQFKHQFRCWKVKNV